eukprot:9125786-Alexandrium_andersonii.AAC.1
MSCKVASSLAVRRSSAESPSGGADLRERSACCWNCWCRSAISVISYESRSMHRPQVTQRPHAFPPRRCCVRGRGHRSCSLVGSLRL